jgi:hypothetical protein
MAHRRRRRRRRGKFSATAPAVTASEGDSSVSEPSATSEPSVDSNAEGDED